MAANRVISVWIFACIQQQPNNGDMTKLRCQGQRQVAVAIGRTR